MASLPMWLEGILNRKYPNWRRLEYNTDGTARYMPAGARVLETSLLRRYASADVVCCYPDDVDAFIGPRTRVVAVSTHNPLGVTFAAGVYTSIFGSARQPINSFYARQMFERIKSNPLRAIVPRDRRRVGRLADQPDRLLRGARASIASSKGAANRKRPLRCSTRRFGESRLPRKVDVSHPVTREAILFPDKRTTFGVVEMTTGCGRRCQFCVPDLNPQIDLPREKILAHVRANVREGNKQISLATEDMFIWGQVHTSTPFYFPNREALLDLYRDVVNTPGVEQHVLSHATIAPVGRRSPVDRAAVREPPGQEPDPPAVLEQPPEAQGARAADRAGNRIGGRGQAHHAEQGRPFSDRRVAECRHSRPGDPQPQQLVSRNDAHRRKPRRNRRRCPRDD